MDLIYGILVIIIIIFIVINFASVTISDTKGYSSKLQTQNQIQPLNQTILNNKNNNRTSNFIPSPLISGAPLALNKKINLEEQTYDYNKYFFV
jgi:hypothetical protein